MLSVFPDGILVCSLLSYSESAVSLIFIEFLAEKCPRHLAHFGNLSKRLIHQTEPTTGCKSIPSHETTREYNSLFPHVTAALQLASQGKLLKTSESIDFIYKDADHNNPLCRTVPYELSSTKVTYDKSKYRELVLDAAETILGLLGFSRNLLNYNKPESYNWLQQIYQDRRKEALSEIELEEGV